MPASRRVWARLIVGALMAPMGLLACDASPGLIPLVVDVPGRSMTKLPFVMAEDQGLYRKYGLDVELRLADDDSETAPGTTPSLWSRLSRRLGLASPRDVDIRVEGHGPTLVLMTEGDSSPHWVALAATDCRIHQYVVAGPEMATIEALEGKRLGVNYDHTVTGMAALLLLREHGWVRDRDVMLIEGADFDELRDGSVDAIVRFDSALDVAEMDGLRVVLDMRGGNQAIAGNSVMVSPDWLDDPVHQEAARRFLSATVEALALYHQQPEVVVDVMSRWYGVTDPDVAYRRYRSADYLPRVPYPCRDGIRTAMQLFDSPRMREFQETDFYDDRILRQLDESGFVDEVYGKEQ